MAHIMTAPGMGSAATQLQAPALETPEHEHREHDRPTAPASSARSLWRGMVLLALAGAAVTLLTFGLMPAAFVALLLLVPAAAPLIVIGLGILIEDTACWKQTVANAPPAPCTCHRDRLAEKPTR